MPTKDTATKILEALEGAHKRRAPNAWLAASETLAREDPAEWCALCLAAGLELMARIDQRIIASAVQPPDTRQGLLAFPQYNEISLEIEEVTLAEYRESTEALRTRIKSYTYPRVTDARLKRDKKELAQREKLDRQVSPLMDDTMKMREGFAAFDRLGGATSEARRKHAAKGGKAGGRGRKRSTKNQ